MVQETPDHSLDVLVVVPIYNGAPHLEELITRLAQFVCDSNLVFINDGSTDQTLDILRRHDRRYISFPHNRGKGVVLQTGLALAVREGYRSVLTLDADLQHLPEEIPRFFAADTGQQLLLGQRPRRGSSMPLLRRLSNFLTSAIVSLFAGRTCHDSQSAFALSRSPCCLKSASVPAASIWNQSCCCRRARSAFLSTISRSPRFTETTARPFVTGATPSGSSVRSGDASGSDSNVVLAFARPVAILAGYSDRDCPATPLRVKNGK